jgi:hypothetical protein
MTAMPALAPDTDVLADAARLCATIRRPAPGSLEPLAGGKNNRVFRVALEGGGSLALKSYFRHPDDPRDRLGAEWGFLTYAWERGVRAIPEPLACDPAAGLGLYGFVEGEKLPPGAVTTAHVAEAAAFVAAINDAPRPRAALRAGSEACFSVADHLARIEARIVRLARLDPGAPHAAEAAAFVADSLAPAWARAAGEVRAESGAAFETPLPEADIIASPSDFGFHNALWTEGRGLVFLDFEYAGWDDPAKLVCDFFGCPEIPAPPERFDLFADILAERLALSAATRARMALLRDAYRIKWACIILNDFLPMDDARRRFADQGDRAARCAMQLEKARAKLADTEQ